MAKVANVTFLDKATGEGEAQLMHMLLTKKVDCVLSCSGVVDTSTHVAEAGTVIDAATVEGEAQPHAAEQGS